MVHLLAALRYPQAKPLPSSHTGQRGSKNADAKTGICGKGLRGCAFISQRTLRPQMDMSAWKWARDVEPFDALPVRSPGLLLAVLALRQQDCIDLWKGLNPDPADRVIVRNYPIRQRILRVQRQPSNPRMPISGPTPFACLERAIPSPPCGPGQAGAADPATRKASGWMTNSGRELIKACESSVFICVRYNQGARRR